MSYGMCIKSIVLELAAFNVIFSYLPNVYVVTVPCL